MPIWKISFADGRSVNCPVNSTAIGAVPISGKYRQLCKYAKLPATVLLPAALTFKNPADWVMVIVVKACFQLPVFCAVALKVSVNRMVSRPTRRRKSWLTSGDFRRRAPVLTPSSLTE